MKSGSASSHQNGSTEIDERSDLRATLHDDSVLNRGVLLVNPIRNEEVTRTYVVLGRTRGGTTMVAKALAALGVHMGENVSKANWEDIDVNRLLNAKDVDTLRKKFEERNERHEVWGVKAPTMFSVIKQLGGALRNPYYLVVMRDPVAIVSRLLAARAIGPDKTKASLLSAMRMYQDILAYVDKTNRPVLYISYEKAITDRKAAAEAIAEFAGSRSPEGIVAAASTITPNSPDYLQAVSRAIASGRSGHSTVRTAPIHRERKVQRPSVKEPNRARAEPLTTPNDRTVETIRTLFPHIGEKPMVIAEVGIGKGATATKIAELMNGKGELYLFDFNERVERVGSLLRSLGYQNVVTHGFTRALWDSYNWPLMKLIEAHKEPIFDFVSLDGTHTWLHDGLAFFLIDRLLKVGGYLDFNDYSWSYEWSAKYHNRPLNLDRMTEEQARTKQVKCVVDLLVKRDPRYKAISEDKVYQKA